MTSNKETPEALTIQLVKSADRGNYCVVYDLKDGNEWKRFNLPGKLDRDWTEIFRLMSQKCPANLVKSIFLNLPDVVPDLQLHPWLAAVRSHGQKFGFSNFHWTTISMLGFTAQLLLAKNKGKKYSIGDYVVVSSTDFAAHLLRKQAVGWDVLDGKVAELQIGTSLDVEGFVRRNNLTMNDVKNFIIQAVDGPIGGMLREFILKAYPRKKVIFDGADPDDLTSDRLEPPGEYLAKVYAGEEYFNDYDCFLGNICIGNLYLQCGSSRLLLPIQFKRVPFSYKKKIKFTRCDKIEILGSMDSITSYNDTDVMKIYQSTVNLKDEIGILTVAFDEDQWNYFKLEKDDEKKTLISRSTTSNEWKDDRPTLIFGKDHVSVDYFKAGLLWKLKDINGNKNIPFKISFDEEVYIGAAADEHPEYLMPDIDLEALSTNAF
uniref:Uncharacterized protein n=1 Tax=Panagrolaimus sp. JU765 TaxID=591449 RepID=A0AC34QWF0_9BILA